MPSRNERARRRLAYMLLARLQLRRFLRSHEPRTVLAIAAAINGAISMLLLALVAVLTDAPFIFPSAGASAFILFYRPLVEAASPRNTLVSHFLGVLAGWLSLVVFGLLDTGTAFEMSADWRRIGAVALAVGLTCGCMVRLRVSHPPAAATSLVVAMGLMPSLTQLPWLMAGVALLVLQAFCMHRFAGVHYPFWSPHEEDDIRDVYGVRRGERR